MNDEHGDFGSVFGRIKDLFRFELRTIEVLDGDLTENLRRLGVLGEEVGEEEGEEEEEEEGEDMK